MKPGHGVLFHFQLKFHHTAPPPSAGGKSKGGKGTPKHDASFDFGDVTHSPYK